jgi:antitoxin (DNA-binding transcriptional repressor) of toxin-antitoxin stability system
MRRTITQRELRDDTSAVLRAVQSGDTFIVSIGNVPVAEIRPVAPRRFVPRAVIAEAARGAPRVDAKRLRRELDAVADPFVDDVARVGPEAEAPVAAMPRDDTLIAAFDNLFPGKPRAFDVGKLAPARTAPGRKHRGVARTILADRR